VLIRTLSAKNGETAFTRVGHLLTTRHASSASSNVWQTLQNLASSPANTTLCLRLLPPIGKKQTGMNAGLIDFKKNRNHRLSVTMIFYDIVPAPALVWGWLLLLNPGDIVPAPALVWGWLLLLNLGRVVQE
jgi:hypothetical protein